MRTETRSTKTFSLDKEVLAAIKNTKGSSSESERVNSLLRFALEMEKRADLEREVAAFFRTAPDDRPERSAFRAAAVKTWAGD